MIDVLLPLKSAPSATLLIWEGVAVLFYWLGIAYGSLLMSY
jgi:hypothetical protein